MLDCSWTKAWVNMVGWILFFFLEFHRSDYCLLEFLNELEAQTGVRKAHWMILSAVIFLSFVLFGFGADALWYNTRNFFEFKNPADDID